MSRCDDAVDVLAAPGVGDLDEPIGEGILPLAVTLDGGLGEQLGEPVGEGQDGVRWGGLGVRHAPGGGVQDGGCVERRQTCIVPMGAQQILGHLML
jgi:hypothetical protein